MVNDLRRISEVADLLLWAASLRPPTLGGGRLLCLDGPAGAGKSTLGRAVRDQAARVGTVELIGTDDLLDGWDGLEEAGQTLERHVLAPVREGRVGRYRRYDWHAGRFAEEVTVSPVDLLVVEGVGSWRSSYARWVTTLVWVDAPADLRLARGLVRDGEALRPRWEEWMPREQALFRREGTRAYADLLVDGTGQAEQAVVLR
jgi:hypothetical protein